jgi:hypothetical protein
MMTTRTFTKLFLSISLCCSARAGLPAAPVNGPEAVATITGGSFCFAHVRALQPERTPPSYLVLHLNIHVSYRNTGTRPLIMPLGYTPTLYTAMKPGLMKIFPQPQNFPDDQTPVLMKHLPADVNPENPANPPNDVFKVIPAGAEMMPALEQDIVLPVNHKTLFRHDPDLRGHRVYLRLQFDHQEIDPALEAELSDRWASFGVPWTGMIRTNTLTFDVPANPQGKPCVDTRVARPFDGHLQTGNNR